MSVKISQLSASAQITSDDFLPIVDSGSLTTKRASASQILDYVTGSTFNSLTVTELTASNITGSVAVFSTISGSTVTGSLAKFTTLSASTAEFSGSVLIYGTASLSSNPSAAYIIYSSSMDKLVAFPGLYVSGNLTGSGLGSFQTVSASTYLGLPTSSGGTPGGTNTTVQFNSGSTFSGSTNLVYNYTTDILSGTTAQFTITTASYSLIQGDLRVLGTASIAQLTTISQSSLLVGDKYITILSGGVDHTGIDGAGFLWGTSSGPGETTGALGEHAHVLYDASRDSLQIFPGLYVLGNASVSGNLTVTGSITELSTRRIKTNIKSLNNELSTISKLNPVSYVRLDDGRKEYGFISEEVKEVYPEFVVGEGISYPKMVSILVSAVKELTDKVEKQQSEIEILKNTRGNL